MDPAVLAFVVYEHNKRSASADRLGAEVSRTLSELLAMEMVFPSVPVHYRVKSLESVIAKVSRRPEKQSLDAIQDFVGVRVVVRFPNDLGPTTELILRNFNIAEYDNKSKQMNVDQFGYVSSHFIANIFDQATDPERPKCVEIQVRTMAQHIWATASHQLQYKHEHDAPLELRRALNRLAALLELADAEFGRLFEARTEYLTGLNETLSDTVVLNVETLRRTLDVELPRANRAVQDDYAVLLGDLARCGISNVGQLKFLVKRQLDNALEFDHQVVEIERSRLGKNGIQIAQLDRPVAMRLENNAFATHTGLIRVMLEYQFNDHYKAKRR